MSLGSRTRYVATVTGTDYPDTQLGFSLVRDCHPCPFPLELKYTEEHHVTCQPAVELSLRMPSGMPVRVGFLEKRFIRDHNEVLANAALLHVIRFDNFRDRERNHRTWTVFDLHFDVCRAD